MKNFLLVLVSTALSLWAVTFIYEKFVAVETRITKVSNLTPEQEEKISDIERNAKPLWRRVQNSTFLHSGPEFKILGHFNNFACHDVIDYGRSSLPNKKRIVFTGDSFVEGVMIPTDQLFYALLRQTDLGQEAEFMGCGVSGWSPSDFLYNIDKDTAKSQLAPDVLAELPSRDRLRENLLNTNADYYVYVMFMGNDLQREYLRGYEKLNKDRTCFKSLKINSYPLLIQKLVRFYYMNYSQTEDQRCTMDDYWIYLRSPAPEIEALINEAYDRVMLSLKLIKQVVEQHHAKFIVGVLEWVPVPYGDEAIADYVRYNSPEGRGLQFDHSKVILNLEQRLGALGIPMINFSTYLSNSQQKDHYYEIDGHLNPVGHAAMAKHLEQTFHQYF